MGAGGRCSLAVLACVLVTVAPAWAGPWAAAGTSYDVGVGGETSYTDPSAVLGEPARYTGEGIWPGAVTPFNPAFSTDQILSLGAGGHLTVRFDQPITDDAAHPYGVDLLIFGNGSFIDGDWPNGVVAGAFDEGPFTVSVSEDGTTFIPLAGTYYDGLYPTLGYADLTDPYAVDAGLVPTDFTKPIDPALGISAFMGKTFPEIAAIYDGSGGGIPIDVHGAGLAEVHYVRIEVPSGGTSPEIDGFAVVPEPAAAVLALSSLLLCGSRRVRHVNL